MDSGFKELIILAVKGSDYGGTIVARTDDPLEELGRVHIGKLPSFLQMNWLSLFSPLRDPVRRLFEEGLSRGTLGYWKDMGPDIVRGLEMYGPDFLPPLPEDELPPEVRRYVRWGEESGTAAPAIRAFGPRWYSHVFSQVKSKRPFGRVFIPDKVDLAFRRRGAFANYSEEPVSASKNFYLIRGSGREGEADSCMAELNLLPGRAPPDGQEDIQYMD